MFEQEKNSVTESNRFCYQQNQFFGECKPCTAAVFNSIIDSKEVNFNISTRQAIEKAISEGTPLDSFVQSGDFLRFCQKEEGKGSGAAFAQLTDAQKLQRWGNWLKNSLPCFIFGVRSFEAKPKKDKNGNGVLDSEGNPIMFCHRQLADIQQMSGLFMFDADYMPVDPSEVAERTQVAGFPWQVLLSHKTSSGHGLRLVCEARPEIGNIADNQIELARELGLLDMMGTSGGLVTDASCIDATRISYAPRREDIYFINQNNLFNF